MSPAFFSCYPRLYGDFAFEFMLLWKLNAAITFISRHHNTYGFTGCKQYTTDQLRLGLPEGVPLFPGQSVLLGGETGLYALERTFHEGAEYLFRKRIDPKCYAGKIKPSQAGKDSRIAI
ncbi:hypothetical protein [Paenibacillus alba]|uniref:Uncharacterized protein n=1 Tax=Paenibacillus alba TaxID=1197127 RepID=A0ABU6G5P5_9BACL|nr:hypothetical protein [Paenibacillus alba]MEC0229491.1 hypothetical protein [Paenibacillus alba]